MSTSQQKHGTDMEQEKGVRQGGQHQQGSTDQGKGGHNQPGKGGQQEQGKSGHQDQGKGSHNR